LKDIIIQLKSSVKLVEQYLAVMSHRGRGLLEVKPSNNPFFQTTSADVGIRPHENIEWKVEGKTPIFHFSNHNVDGNFSFLYTRESDKIGSQVRKPESKEIKVLTKTEFLKKKVEQAMSVTNSSTGYSDTIIKPSSPFKRSAEDILKVYKHAPKVEDPRYTTSMVRSSNRLHHHLSSSSFIILS